MSNSAPSNESDLAFLKRLAVAGRGEPAPFLLLMAVFGLGYGLTAIGLYISVLTGFPVTPGSPHATIKAAGYMLLASHVAFLVTLLWTGWRTFGPRRIRLSRAASATWTAAFLGLVVILIAIRLFARDEPPTDQVYSIHFIGPVLLVLWGCAWWVTAILTERRWLLAVATGSFAAALAMAWTQNTPPGILVGGLSLVLLAFVPAVLLMLERRR